MITYRSRGLINLHIVATTLLASGFLLLLASLSPYIPWIALSPAVSLPTCVLVAAAGMLLSARFLTQLGGRFHSLGWPDAAWLATRQVAMMALVSFTVIVATKDRSVSRLFLAHYLVLSWVLLLFVNRILPRYLAELAFGRQHRLPTILLGKQETLARLDGWIAERLHLGIIPVGFLSEDEVPEGFKTIGPQLGGHQDLSPIIEKEQVAQVIMLDLPDDKEETARVVEACQAAGCRLLIYDNMSARLPVPMTPVAEEGYYFFTAQTEPLEDPFNRLLKRAFDVAISLPVVVFILPPLCAWVWVMQRLQAPGPLLFVRARGGKQRTEFKMLKFRSMYCADPGAGRENEQAKSGDDRIYPFGRFLRKTSLDEFPQFWNCLMGEMSIVGPRPHLPQHDEEFSKVARTYRTRHLAKPGITGLAQVRGFRGEITDPLLLEKRVSEDIIYITRWSIWLDLLIMVKTLRQVFFPPKTAY